MTKLFIAASSKDEAIALRVVEALTKVGHEVYHYSQAKLGKNWPKNMADMLDWAEKVICLISPDFLASEPCMDELGYAYSRKKLTMVLIKASVLPGHYAVILYLDLTKELSERRVDDALAKLVAEFPPPNKELDALMKIFNNPLSGLVVTGNLTSIDERFIHGAEGYVLDDDDPDPVTE